MAMLTTFADPDLWGHVRFGLDILREGLASGPDPYTFTQGRAFLYHEWLGGVIMALAYRVGGPVGLWLLKAALAGGLFILLWELLRDKVFAWRWGALAVAAWSTLPLFATLRPQLWTAIGVVLVSRILIARPTAHYWLPIIFAVWANLHGGWMVGGAILFIWTGVAWIQQAPQRTNMLLVGMASFLATLATPYGVELWAFLFETVRLERADISEWQPVWRNGAGPILVWALGAATVVVSTKRTHRPTPAALAVLVAIGFASARVTRLAPLFALVAVVLLSPAWPSKKAILTDGAHRIRHIVAELVLVAVSLTFATRVMTLPTCLRIPESPYSPDTQAAEALRGVGGRLVTYFDWGEYILWHFGPSLKVSIDGRRETLYTPDTVREQLAIFQGTPAGIAALERLRPDYVWLPAVAQRTADWLAAHRYRIEVQTAHSFIAVRSDLAALPGRVAAESSGCFPGP